MQAKIVVGLGFGDEGKGSTVDYLTRQCTSPPVVIRYNGAGQAAHNVHTPDGKHHTFSQFGSGTLAGARTHLSKYMLVEPFALMNEAKHLSEIGCVDPFKRLTIDRTATIVTPFHKAANRIREFLRGKNAHGTCGLGIGETVSSKTWAPAIHAGELFTYQLVKAKMETLQEKYRIEFLTEKLPESLEPEWRILMDKDTPALFAEAFANIARGLTIVHGPDWLASVAESSDFIFEGAQGVLLDETYGFAPHTTWSNTTPKNATQILYDLEYQGDITTLGVLRAYSTRHGNGPFPTENADLTALLPDSHNKDTGWQGKFRAGWFDVVLAKYALDVCADEIDSLVITNLDRFEPVTRKKVCVSYSNIAALDVDELDAQSGLLTLLLNNAAPDYVYVPNKKDYVGFLEAQLGIDISMVSRGTTYKDKFGYGVYAQII